jgi:hypothetical protein
MQLAEKQCCFDVCGPSEVLEINLRDVRIAGRSTQYFVQYSAESASRSGIFLACKGRSSDKIPATFKSTNDLQDWIAVDDHHKENTISIRQWFPPYRDIKILFL